MDSKKCQVVFFGTPDFSVPTLEALSKASAKGGQEFLSIKAVVTQPDKPVGRHHSTAIPSPVKQAAQALNLPVLEGLDALRGIEADLGVVVAFGAILPQWVIDKFPLGIVNIHPSLLPKYRGTSPIQAAILNQDKEIGVSIIQLDKEMDHGPILAQENHPLPPPVPRSSRTGGGVTASLSRPPSFTKEGVGGWSGGPTAGELYETLFKLGADLLIKILPDYIAGKIELKPQDDSQATFTKKLTKENGQIDWSKSPAEIDAHVRAMNPWPGAWTMWSSFAISRRQGYGRQEASEDKNNKRLIIWKTSLIRHSEPSEESQRLSTGSFAGAQDDGLILEEIQLEGKKKMAFAEFCKGHPEFDLSKLQRSTS